MSIGLHCSRITQLITLTTGLIFIPGCATQNNIDPLEGLNRTMFKVDRAIDKVVLKPVAHVYDKLLPTPVHTGVDNFFSNTFEPARIANDLLQLDIKDALNDLGRFMVNTTLGIGGLFDFASKMGMTKHRNDFGITLAKWGFRRSAYLYIPLLGPMTIRDSLSIGVDYFLLSPVSYIQTDKIRLSLLGLGKVHYRWQWLPADKVINDSFDPYIFVRNAYLQKRDAMIGAVVSSHHAAEDTFVHGLEDPIVPEEDHQDTEQLHSRAKIRANTKLAEGKQATTQMQHVPTTNQAALSTTTPIKNESRSGEALIAKFHPAQNFQHS